MQVIAEAIGALSAESLTTSFGACVEAVNPAAAVRSAAPAAEAAAAR